MRPPPISVVACPRLQPARSPPAVPYRRSSPLTSLFLHSWPRPWQHGQSRRSRMVPVRHCQRPHGRRAVTCWVQGHGPYQRVHVFLPMFMCIYLLLYACVCRSLSTTFIFACNEECSLLVNLADCIDHASKPTHAWGHVCLGSSACTFPKSLHSDLRPSAQLFASWMMNGERSC